MPDEAAALFTKFVQANARIDAFVSIRNRLYRVESARRIQLPKALANDRMRFQPTAPESGPLRAV